MISFDIETEPRPEDELKELCPPLDESQFEVGEFDPASVKLGNMKDQKKIDEKIAKARAEHQKLKDTTHHRLADARAKHFGEFKSKATLNAALSKVLVIGYYSSNGKFVCDSADEKILLENFWRIVSKKFDARQPAIGLNIHEFDLPFITRRSWINGVEIPIHMLTDLGTKWPKFHPRFIDVGKWWLAGAFSGSCKWGFDTLAAAFGTSGKAAGETTGKNFHEMWHSNQESAIEYLKADVMQPMTWAKCMGIK